MTKVLVLWADTRSANFGVQVLARGLAELATRAWGPETVVEFQNYMPGDSPVSFTTRSIARDFGRRNGPIKTKLREYDVILDSGAGDSFTDIYGLKRHAFMVYASRSAARLGIPLAMGPQTIGPFTTAAGRRGGKYCLDRASVVQSRDDVSAEYSATLGRPVDARATDVVFALPRAEVPKSRDVVVNVSGLLWFSDRHGDSAGYRNSVRSLLGELRSAGRQVSLLAHVVDAVSVDDDVAAVRALEAEFRSALEVVVPRTLDEVRSTVGSAEWVVGARMHACLNALSMGTPAIPWAYSRKFAPLMSDLGWDLSVDLAQEQNPGETTAQVITTRKGSDVGDQLKGVHDLAEERLEAAVASLQSVGAP
ncbi:polysaccharide pyruvyl transferase [Rhodococcus sp. SC4]|nr:polysaccharide pyruvyl transferase [Rhodococcus sp. SC4]